MIPFDKPLFRLLLASEIWQESKETRLVWITMLAMANRDGIVSVSIPGLAHFARLRIEEVEAALDKFLNPEENLTVRKSQDHEGWHIRFWRTVSSNQHCAGCR